VAPVFHKRKAEYRGDFTLLARATPFLLEPGSPSCSSFAGKSAKPPTARWELAPSDVKGVLEEQYQRILHNQDYRQALVHGMWSWDVASPNKITATRIRKKKIIRVHLTADDLEEFALAMGEINLAIQYPRGLADVGRPLDSRGWILQSKGDQRAERSSSFQGTSPHASRRTAQVTCSRHWRNSA
jgi:hypothetical protein